MKVILASQSPRRIELLKSIGLQFETIPSEAAEIVREGEKPDTVVMSLALEKGLEIASKNEDAVVMAFDTVVFCDEILGKPKDEADAYRMLKLLNGKSHQVFTGIAVIHLESNTKIIDYTMTNVAFIDAEDDMLHRYVDTKEPLDKAGAYGIQGYGAMLVECIEGDYYSVMGLPLSKLSELLRRTFNIQLL